MIEISVFEILDVLDISVRDIMSLRYQCSRYKMIEI